VPQTRHFDAIVIGSGQAGGPLTTALAGAGQTAALIEREHVGGTCINVGCTPTKTMVASARAAYMARRSSDYGIHDGTVSVDMVEVRRRKQEIVDTFREGSTNSITSVAGVDLIMGEAAFTGANAIDVQTSAGEVLHLSADRLFIDTGARPVVPSMKGLKTVPFLDSTSIMELSEIPEHLLVMGGGYVGLEFGQMFRRFGSRVTIVQRGPQLVGREDSDIASAVADILREDGIEILLETEAQQVAGGVEAEITLQVKNAAGEQTLTGTHLLVAAGRAPNTEHLNLSAAGVETDQRGFIKVNERLETSAPNIWALGDVTGSPAFTHMSYDDFRIVRDNLLHQGDRTTKNRQVPYTVFIDPQLGRVGLSETEAREQGLRIKVAKMPMNNVARALEVGETRGIMKVIVDAESDHILGCAILGLEGGELMAMIEIAMLGQLRSATLHEAIFAHPTLAESFNSLFSNFEG
jgi:pyruvate/2-oxoglutarate dehydrogenase complex dihydrolipoamide dehydrogenase (E3) component